MNGVIVGKICVATVAGLEITIDEATVDPVVEDIKDKSTTARGRTRHIGGFSEAKITIKGYFDPTNNPLQPGVRNLRAGSIVQNLKLQMDPDVELQRWLAPSVIVESAKVSDVAAGRADFEASFFVDTDLYYPLSDTAN